MSDTAIEALRYSEFPNSSDCISRQAAIDDIKAIYEYHDTVTEDRIIDHLKRLPSAQPEVIYCKDCKWKQGAECVRFADVRPFPSDFCSRAERRTDEAD